MTGVRRAWRGRGIAGALKRTQLAWAKANGYERLETANETRNVPIQRLSASATSHSRARPAPRPASLAGLGETTPVPPGPPLEISRKVPTVKGGDRAVAAG